MMLFVMSLMGCTPELGVERVCNFDTFPADTTVIFEDADRDGWPNRYSCNPKTETDGPSWVVVVVGEVDSYEYWDCDDGDDTVTEGAVWYADTDLDGFGDPATSLLACSQPDGFVPDGTDCDDGDEAYNPGADESDCTDPHDYNCDGEVAFEDSDDDGVAACEDCDDTNDTVEGVLTWYADADLDGYGNPEVSLQGCDQPEGYVDNDGDCEDEDDRTFPGAAAQDSEIDCMTDDDEDGFGSNNPATGVTAGTDCDDSQADYYPGAEELCDIEDRDCDGMNGEDDEDVIGDYVYYADDDNDGYGGDTELESCHSTAPSGYEDNSDDCDDTDATVGECLVYVSCSYNGSSYIDVTISFDSAATVSDITGGSTSSASAIYLRKPVGNEQVDKIWSGVGATYTYSAFSRGDLEVCFADECSSHLVQANIAEVIGDCSDASTGTDLIIDAN